MVKRGGKVGLDVGEQVDEEIEVSEEKALNGFVVYVRRQHAVVQDYGDKLVRERETNYDITQFKEENK